ncbi:MAG TPA: hypothetical protein VGO48_06065 [Conexibacter sp.]|nr:hypothetical protein [Conexibacter sp.]
MRWPSKDPNDYAKPGRWETDPPRWLAKRRGLPVPDPTPFWMNLCATFGGLIGGGMLGEALGEDATAWALLGTVLAQSAVAVGWRMTHRRRKGEPAS